MATPRLMLLRAGVLALLLLAAPACRAQQPALPPPASQTEAALADTTFARLIEQLSGPGAYFDTDNLISNEASYLHVMSTLAERGVEGGAYLGVGPDQNFSYMAQVRPAIAFMVDIRRDNLLQHLLFKALFTLAPNRITYLSLLFGTPPPDDAAAWTDRSIDDLLAYLDATPATAAADAVAQVQAAVQRFGVPLSTEDRATIERFHRTFIEAGPELRFTSHGRRPMPYYPTYRQLLLERDLTGRRANYLVREDDYQFLRQMQLDNRVIPVVGDLAGAHALPAIARYLRAHGEQVAAFYTSNVEYYLMADGTFDAYAENVQRLPRAANGVIIRSYFNRWRTSLPQTQPGYVSTQLLEPLDQFVETYESGGYRTYDELLRTHAVE